MSSASLPIERCREDKEDYLVDGAEVSDFDGVYQRMLGLESELAEFQESSKELEQALEEELRQLESQNSRLSAQVRAQDVKIRSLSEKIIELNTEMNTLHEEMVEKTEAYTKETRELKGKLVSIEISNDDMISHDRVLESKLQLSTQFNNELLEKLAIVENDLELEKQENSRQKLVISNLENFRPIRRSTRASLALGTESVDVTLADGTILDINEMLASEPKDVRDLQVPKSTSITKLHSFLAKSEVLRQKTEEMSTTLASYTGEESRRHSRIPAEAAEGVRLNHDSAKIPAEKQTFEPPHRTVSHTTPSLHSSPGGILRQGSLRKRPPSRHGFRTSVKKLFFT